MAQVVVIGNIALDETLAVEAFPAPGASIPGTALAEGLGGKGANQAIVLGRAGPGVRFVTALGRDARGARLRAGLADEPVELTVLARDLATDFSIILRDASRENTIVTTQACAQSITPEEGIAALNGANVLVLQGNLAVETSLALLQTGGTLRILNPSPVAGCTAEMLALADILVVNEGEAAHFGGTEALSKAKALVRTRGAKGAELWLDGALSAQVPGQDVAALDPTGAGDCFLGALVASMLRRGARQPDATDLALASWAAGVCVSRLGTQNAFPTAAEFSAAFAAKAARP